MCRAGKCRSSAKAKKLLFSNSENNFAATLLSLALRAREKSSVRRKALRPETRRKVIFLAFMKIQVRAKPNSHEEKVEKIDDAHFIVSVKEPPEKGKANQAIRNALAVYFKTSSSSVRIISGWSSCSKIVEIA